MKRTDLMVGEVLYHTRLRGWEDAAHSGHKATVVDTQPYRSLRQGYYGRDRKPWAPDPKGAGVLVDIDYGLGGVREVVSLATLKGPYEQVAAQVKEQAEARRARVQAANEARQAEASARDAMLARAEQAGIKASMVYEPAHRERYVMLPVKELARLLARLEEG
jgi:predicted trehalose synthase